MRAAGIRLAISANAFWHCQFWRSYMDYAAARRNMVESQVRPNDVTDRRIQDAMARIPRERFLPKSKQPLAYMDYNIAIGEGRILMEPRCFAKMLQAAEVKETDVVLDIGCGTGYSTAILAALASAVVALESDDALVDMASEILTDMAVDNAAVVTGPLEQGCSDQSPFDVIFVNGSVEVIPQIIFDQLGEGGRLVAVVVAGQNSHARIYNKTGHDGEMYVSSRVIFDAKIPVLTGFQRAAKFVF